MNIATAEVDDFIRTARNIAGRDRCSPFSLEDTYAVARRLALKGILFLEKMDDRRHVNVLFELNKNVVTIYDPLSGAKSKTCNEIQLGMYCKPEGSFFDEFQRYEHNFELEEHVDIWARYQKKGGMLLEFFKQHDEFISIYSNFVSSMVTFPAFQDNTNSSDCAPIALLVMSLCNSHYSKILNSRRLRIPDIVSGME